MDFLMLAIVFIFGAIVGSFLNVVIYRYNSGTSPMKGRSQCFSCGKTLEWHELVPIFSFLFQRGRCKKCGVRLSWQYPIVEILSGIIFIAVFLLEQPVVPSVILIAIFSTLLVISVYDLRHQIIPDGLVALFILLGLVQYVLFAGIENVFKFPFIWTLFAGPILFFPFWALWYVSKGKWIGLGDGKLSFGIGWFLGLTSGASAIMLAFWIGALYALVIMGAQKASQKLKALKSKINASVFLSTFDFRLFDSSSKLSFQSEIPFGPFLILGLVITYFSGINFFDGSTTFLTFL